MQIPDAARYNGFGKTYHLGGISVKSPLALAPWILGISAILSSPVASAMGTYQPSGWYIYDSSSNVTSHQLATVKPAVIKPAVLPASGGYHGWVWSGSGFPASQPIKLPTSSHVIILPPKVININGPNAGGPLVAIPGAPAPDATLGAEFTAAINQERTNAGLPALQTDPTLMRLATLKAQDLVVNNYFDHYSMRYGYPFDMMRRAGITFQNAGENLAGAASVPAAVNALMASPEHKANILSPYYTRTGFAVIHGGNYGLMIVQEFVG